MNHPIKQIQPFKPVQATLTLPGSKSYTHRALVAASLAVGDSLLTNPLRSEDTELTARALAQLGAGIDWQGAAVRVRGVGGRWLPVSEPLHLGNSGTSMRFLTALAALRPGPYVLTGAPRLCQRPMDELLQALGQLGVSAISQKGDGCPPVVVQGGLRGGWAVLSGGISSQYLSALLFISPLAPEGVEIEVTGELVSRPYVDLTLEVMGAFGVSYYRRGYSYFRVTGGQRYLPREYAIEADASSASYFWAAAAVTGGRVTIANLKPDSCQGDAAFPEVLARMGCVVAGTGAGLAVRGGPLSGIQVDMSALPDLVPTLAVVAAFAQGETILTGVGHLRHKESDRLAAVAAELRKMGIAARETPDGLIIPGGEPHAALIDPHQDHRLAMSFAVAGLKVPGVVIDDPGCVAKSFPDFWDYFDKLYLGGR